MPDEPIDQKALMLAEVETDLPEGIRSFLTTPLPAKAELTSPVDVDSAIICQAEFCVHLNNMLGLYEGLTPISIPMWIGQMNTVQQSMLLASLEATEPAEDDAAILEIVEPKDGTAYKPGELRITVNADKELVRTVNAQLGEADSLQLRDVEGDAWRDYVDVTAIGDYTLTVMTTLFDDDEEGVLGPLTQSVTFSVADDAEEIPEGADMPAFETAESKMQEALKALADQSVLDVPGYAQSLLNVVKAQYGVMGDIAAALVSGDVKGAIDTALTEVDGTISNFEQEIENYDPDGDPFELGNFVGKLWNIGTKIDGFLESVF